MGLPDPKYDPQFYDGVPLRRLVAFLLDTIAVIVIMLMIVMVGVVLGVATLGLGFVFVIPAVAIAGFVYRFTLIRERSATLGMMLAGIELRGPDGERLDSMTAFIHTALFHATMLMPVLMVVGWILLAMDPQRRLLHDLPIGTAMINRPA